MKNIVAIEVNNKYCGVLTDNLEIKILSKKNDKACFSEHLRLENALEKLNKDLENTNKTKNELIRKILINVLEVISSLVILGFSSNIMLFLSSFLTLLSSSLTVGNMIRFIKTKKERQLINEELDYYTRVLNENGVSNVCSKKFCVGDKNKEKYFYNCAIQLDNLLKSFIEEKIDTMNVIYLDREVMNEYNCPIKTCTMPSNKKNNEDIVSKNNIVSEDKEIENTKKLVK